jgi:glycosyltransferase involved in cell wall biosynthesis
MTIIEAMAAALPVVTTPVGIAPEVIRDGENGWLARDSSVSELRDAIERSLQEHRRWPEVGRTARADAAAFPVEAMVNAHERLYSDANLRRSGDQPSVPHEAPQ